MTRKEIFRSLIISLNVLVIFILSYFVNNQPSSIKIKDVIAPTNKSQQVLGEENSNLYLVKRVIDGDTIELDNGLVVRYIGIDAPEKSTSKKTNCFSKEAEDANSNLVEGKTVRLEKDVSEVDRYGRLLRYVFVTSDNQETFVNQFLVGHGYASVSTYPPDVKYQDLFLNAQESARLENLGLWKCS